MNAIADRPWPVSLVYLHLWLLAVSLLVVGWPPVAAAQSCVVCDGSPALTVDELVGAINKSLGGCEVAPATPTTTPTATATVTHTPTPRPTVTPTRPPSCRSGFTTRGTNLCSFRGRFNLGCGNSLTSSFSSDGSTLLIRIDTQLTSPPTVAFSARVDGVSAATLTGWSTDNFATVRPTTGSVQLTNDGQQLVIFPNTSPFMIQSCAFVQYNGSFLAGTGALGADRASSDSTAFTHLQEWRVAAPPELAD